MESLDIVLLVLSSSLVVSVFTSIWQYWVAKRFSSEKRSYQRIYDTFILNGLYPTEAAISEYGTATTLAFADLIPGVRECLGKDNEKEAIEALLDEIGKRELVTDLMSRNYKIVGERFPRLQVFGMELYSASKRTIDAYSKFLRSNLKLSVFMEQVERSREEGRDNNWIPERLAAAANLLQQTQLYMEARIRQLDDYLYEKGFTNYSEFTRLKDEENVKRLREELKEYLAKQGDFSAHTTQENSLALNKWLSDHEDINPLKRDRKKVARAT